MLWWLVNGSWLLLLSAVALRHQFGAIWWVIAAFSIYSGAIFAGFVLNPHRVPEWVEMLCFGNMEAEYYALLWPSAIDLWPDSVDKTWRWPAIAAIVELLGFAGSF